MFQRGRDGGRGPNKVSVIEAEQAERGSHVGAPGQNGLGGREAGPGNASAMPVKCCAAAPVRAPFALPG